MQRERDITMQEGDRGRQTENLHRYPMKDNRAFAIAFHGGRERQGSFYPDNR